MVKVIKSFYNLSSVINRTQAIGLIKCQMKRLQI